MNVRGLKLFSAVICLLLVGAASAQARFPGRFPGSTVLTAGAATPIGPSTPVTRGSGYVALGDSVTFGYQEAQVTPAPDYLDAASFRGYPEQIGTALHLKVANFACPGETARSLINQQHTLACENGYRAAYPLHVKYRGSQLSAAVTYLEHHSGVRLVSLMIGANDLFQCQDTTADHCAAPSELAATLAEVQRSVHTIVGQIRNKAGYSGQIVILNYYSTNYASSYITGVVRRLNMAQDAGAKPFQVRIANGFAEFQNASMRFGASPCTASLLTNLGGAGNCGVHPSYAGQALLAKALTAATIL